MEILFVIFALVSACVLGGLSVLVLEYQNVRSRKWIRFLDQSRPVPTPLPSLPPEPPEQVSEPEEAGVLITN